MIRHVRGVSTTWSGLHAQEQLYRFGARGRYEVSIGLGGVLVVQGFFPHSVVGYLQEKTFIGGRPPNEAPPMAKLALFIPSLWRITRVCQRVDRVPRQPVPLHIGSVQAMSTDWGPLLPISFSPPRGGFPEVRLRAGLEMLRTENPPARLKARLEMVGTESPRARLKARLEMVRTKSPRARLKARLEMVGTESPQTS
ncbi:hypothetical protein GW17_00026297 [Ensete ventricosum]|nr:hypothetical protein GW17_00026297 [Ensete ventricosum]